MKLYFIILTSLAFIFYSCSGETTVEGKEGTSQNVKIEERKTINAEEDIETLPEDVETLQEEIETTYALEDKTYPVLEFFTVFEENKNSLVDQEVTISGYYMNHNKQRNSDNDKFEFNVTLYEDDSFERKGPQVFFIMKENNAEQFDGIKQGDKLTISGEIQDRDFFGAPFLTKGEIIE